MAIKGDRPRRLARRAIRIGNAPAIGADAANRSAASQAKRYDMNRRSKSRGVHALSIYAQPALDELHEIACERDVITGRLKAARATVPLLIGSRG